jgi:hypothetical protein
MPNHRQLFRRTSLCAAIIFSALAMVVHASVPRGWSLAGSQPDKFEVGLDVEESYQNHLSVFLKSKQWRVNGFGTLMQSIQAEQYKRKKVHLSGLVKAEEVVGWAGLWMRVDRGRDAIALDNMHNRPIKGATGWKQYEVVLDVPQDATGISFGSLLDGAGEVWLNSAKFDVVGAAVPVTGPGDRKIPDRR